MKSMIKNLSQLAMLIGLFIEVSLIIISFAYTVLKPFENVLLWSLSASTVAIGTIMCFFVGFDYRCFTGASPSGFDDYSIAFVLSYPLILYPTILLTMLFKNESFPLDEWTLFFLHGGVNIIGFILYFTGRRYLKSDALIELGRRRRGKRSHVRKHDLERMAKDDDFVSLCKILLNDINFRNREIAAELLSFSKDPSTIDCLLQGLEDEELSVRLASSISLVSLDRHEGRGILEEVLASGHRDDKTKVIKALRTVDQSWAIALIKETHNRDGTDLSQ